MKAKTWQATCSSLSPKSNPKSVYSLLRWLFFLAAYLSHLLCVSKFFERIILTSLLFFLESNFILSPRQAGFRQGRSTLDQILYLSQSISNCFYKPTLGSQNILATINFSKAFGSSGIPPFSTSLFRLVFLLDLLVGLNLFFLIGALAWFIKIHQSFLSSPSRFSARIRSWPCTFLSLHQ